MAARTVTKKDLAKAVAKRHDMTHMEAGDIIKSVFDQIIEELGSGNRLELRDFGVFEPRTKRGRKARNPRTGETVYTEDGVAVRFKTGKKMGEAVQECLGRL